MRLILLILFLSTHSTLANALKDKCFDAKIEAKVENFKISKESGIRLSMSIEDDLDISKVSLDEIQQIFNLLKSKRYIPFDYKKMGCEARAHEMVRIMDKMCLSSAKAFLIGDISLGGISWVHHVAPILYVQNKDQITPYILDPSVSDRAIPLNEWLNILRRSNLLGYYNLNITNQYTYRPEEIDSNNRKYRFRDIVKTKLGLGIFKAYETVDEFPSDLIHLLKKVIN